MQTHISVLGVLTTRQTFAKLSFLAKTPLQGQKVEVMRRLRLTHLFFERKEKSFALTEKNEVVTVTHLRSNAYNAYFVGQGGQG